MDDIRIMIEQEIANLPQYEAQYQKALMASDGSDELGQIERLYKLDHRIQVIRSWLGLLSAEEYLVVTVSISEAKPYETVLYRFEQSFGHLLPGSEGLVYVYRERGLTRIANILCDECETATRLLRRLEGYE